MTRTYPELSEPGQKFAQQMIDSFKAKMKDVSEEIIGNLYCDVAQYIESDSWTNFRNQFMTAFRKMDQSFCSEYDLRDMAKSIAKEFPDLVGKYINEDLQAELKRKEEHIKWLEELRRDSAF